MYPGSRALRSLGREDTQGANQFSSWTQSQRLRGLRRHRAGGGGRHGGRKRPCFSLRAGV